MTRLENIRANPNVEVVVDGYDEDWERLWWVRAGGSGRVVGEDQARRGLDLLRAKYPQYAQDPPDGPVVAIDLTRVAGWEGRR